MRFGHHPDPAVDFCVEVDAIKGLAADVEAGLETREALEERVSRAMEFRVGGDPRAVAAKDELRKIGETFKKDGVIVHKNGPEGVQVEWRGILFTLRLGNTHHGIAGSIAEQDGDKTLLLTFHGTSASKPLPLQFHEEWMERPEGRDAK